MTCRRTEILTITIIINRSVPTGYNNIICRKLGLCAGGLPAAIQRLNANHYKGYEGCIGDVRIQDSGYVNLGQNSMSGKNVASCNR